MNRISATETFPGNYGYCLRSKPFAPFQFDSCIDFGLHSRSREFGNNFAHRLRRWRSGCFSHHRTVPIIFHPKVLRAAMGAHFHIPVITKDWQEITSELSKLITQTNVYLSDIQDGAPLWKCDFLSPTVIIISNEATGATPTAKELASDKVHIPMPGGFESLNASIAAAVLLFEVVRQRKSS